MKEWFKQKKLRSICAAGLLASGLVAGAVGTIGATGSSAASNVTLTMESSPTNTLSQSFNPFSTSSAAYLVAATSFIYEPLLQFDAAKSGVIYPWLATKYAWGNGGKSITFTIRTGVKWSNGTALTPADVAFTYNLVKNNPSINTGGLDLTSVTTSGDTVTLNFPTSQYTNLQPIASVYIVPQSIWSTVGNPSTYVDATPIGSGPYTLGTFTAQGFTLVRNPSYWNVKHVRIGTLDFPAYASNTNAEEALFNGSLTWAGNFIPNLKKLFLSKFHPSQAWEAPNGTVSLWPNLTRFPLNQLAVRQAVSLAINRTAVGEQGEAGLEPPVLQATGLTLPLYGAYLLPAIKNMTFSPTANPSAAKAVLEKAGWKMGSNGYFEKGGKTLAFSIEDPSSYTDYAADGAILASELKKAGMDVTFDGVSVTAWSSDVASGNFDSVIHWSAGGLTPYQMYNNWLNSALDTKPSASGDFEQLKDPALNAQLVKVQAAPNAAAEAQALLPLEEYVAKNLPVIGMVDSVAWSEINESSIKGWPSPSNPYESGQPATPTNEVVVLHLAPRS